MSRASSRELAHLNSLHDVFLGIVDASFAFELPGVSAGWIEAFDVESGRSRVMSRRELSAMAGRVREWQDDGGADGQEGRPRCAAARVGPDQVRRGVARMGGGAAAPQEVVRQVRQVRQVRRVRQVRQVLVRRSGCVRVLPLVIADRRRAAGASAAPQNVEVDPVTCWWRTSMPSVRVGETVRAHADLLGARDRCARGGDRSVAAGHGGGAVPAVRGRSAARRAPTTSPPAAASCSTNTLLRLITEDVVRPDVPSRRWRSPIASRAASQQDAAVQGREQTYVLPPLTMRVASLVPDDARAHPRSRRCPRSARSPRASSARACSEPLALILFGIAALTLLVALAPVAPPKP